MNVNAHITPDAFHLLNGYRVYLDLDNASEKEAIIATVIIAKPAESPPIRRDSVVVMLEDVDGGLLRQRDSRPGSGWLPEARTRSVTASAEYRFENRPVDRGIVIIDGKHTVFQF